MFKVGDRVKVVDTGAVYSRYLHYLADIACHLNSEDIAKFKFNEAPEKNEELKVVYVGQHPNNHKEKLYVCVNSEHLFIMGEEGVEHMEKHLCEGCKVRINDDGKIYSSYSDFILAHRVELRRKSIGRRDKYLFNYAYEKSPTPEEEKGTFTIILMDKHPEDWAGGRILCVIESNVTSRVFLIDETGLSEVD